MVLFELKNIFQQKYVFFSSAALLVIPIYSWKTCFQYWKKLKKAYDKKVLFQKRHNCVLTYRAHKGLYGWPPDIRTHTVSSPNMIENLYEPIIYFIKTATESLDVAIMIINVKTIYAELIHARRRGVKIRIFCNFQHSDSSRTDIRALMSEVMYGLEKVFLTGTDEFGISKTRVEFIKCNQRRVLESNKGVEYQFFVAPSSTMDSIMHNKYMVKDCNNKQEGYVCMGSMNFTSSAVMNNYESFIFTANQYVVEAFKNNFEECWHNVKMDNEGLINRTILMDAHF